MDPEAYIEMDKTESMHWWFTGRRAILSNIFSGLNLPINAEILEIGCGTGGNLQMLAEHGEVSALEIDTNARQIASEKTNNAFNIKAGRCPDEIPFEPQSFDLICLFDVLEHIDQDTETLTAIKKLLKKNGVILITVPAYQWLWSTHDAFLHHKRRYSAHQLKKIITNCDLNSVKLSYFNSILFPLAVAARVKDKLLHNSSATGTKTPPPIINSLFNFLFSSERFLLKHYNLPFGVSLLGIFNISNENQ